MSMNRKWCAAKSQEGVRHAVSEFRRAAIMEISLEDTTRCNITTAFEVEGYQEEEES